MKSFIPALVAVVLLGVASPAGARTTSAPRPLARLDVSGQGSIDRAPDQAVVSFSIVTNDDNATQATSAANGIYNALVARLHALGVDPAAIKTTSYGVSYNPRPAQPNPQFQQRYGFVVTRAVAVTSAQTDRVGAIIDAAIAAGVTNVNDVAFGLHDNRSPYRAALAAALSDADGQARALAAEAHVHIVRVLAISAGGSSVPIHPVTRFAALAAGPPPPVPTDLQSSSLSITATVSVTYEIAP
jgi:uncharacterized protein YggE